ncbi:hypothetical protein E7Z54_14655, partial [Nocardioides sp.]
MGWSWPWRRSDAAHSEVRPEQSAAGTSRTTASPPAPSPMGWAFLPPIQRQLAEPIQPLSRGFAPGAWDSPVFTGQMTHAVSDAAPQGLIDGDGGGLGTPVQRSTHGPELTLLPPPRPRAARTAPPTTEEGGDDHQAMAVADPGDRAADEPVR